MNNVSPKVHSFGNIEEEGSGKVAVVLFFCALFLVYQICFLPILSHDFSSMEAQLNVTPECGLSVAVFDPSKKDSNSNEQNLLESPGHYHFAPFFFKPIPINYSDMSLLMSVKGIGPSLAERIITERNKNGLFTSPKDLLKVKGIGTSRLLKLKPYLSFSKDNVPK